ncbi:hypothetical protein P0136_07235 [Lentisphaerota bacterium ZTH]|nr:hypothetical protein JYG24_01650 [Lentisphaerota bacterium]WET05161.1 hypothetical protein P0136_07235 [Lentisphaerota bacterium ZTH]
MSKYFNNNHSWNEFEWECEIRRDEKRIHRYFQLLPSCLDMPDEENTIMNKIMSQPDLVPSSADWSGFAAGPEFLFEDDEDSFNTADIKRRKGADIFLELQKLAWEWNVCMVRDLRPSLQKDGLAVVCLFGNLLSRSADMIELDSDNLPNLKISLAKRILKKINKLLGKLNSLQRRQAALRHKLEAICVHLQNVREKVVDMLTEFRLSMNEK